MKGNQLIFPDCFGSYVIQTYVNRVGIIDDFRRSDIGEMKH